MIGKLAQMTLVAVAVLAGLASSALAEARLTACWNGQLTVSQADFRPVPLPQRDLRPGMAPREALKRIVVVPSPAKGEEGGWMMRTELCRSGGMLAMVVLDDGGADDSVQSTQRLLLFEGASGQWRLVWAGERWRCHRGAQPGRWTKKFCL